MLKALYRDYISGTPNVLSLFGTYYLDPEVQRNAVEAASHSTWTKDLINALEETATTLPDTPEKAASLAAIKEPGTVAVITGQQAGIYFGPLYTYYKILSAVHVAKELEERYGVRAVPIFWLQNEDHDAAEISISYLPGGPGDIQALQLDSYTQEEGSRISISQLALGNEITECNRILSDILASYPHAEAYLQKFISPYKPEAKFDQAFIGLFGELLGNKGVLVFDPCTPTSRPLKRSMIERALMHEAEITQALLSQRKRIDDAGFGEQVFVRENSPLFFFHPDGPTGPRYRLERTSDSWQCIGSDVTISHGELQRRIHRHPEDFSTSALLRPLLQDDLFPVAAYVGGPSEISYFAQITPLYELLSVKRPLIVPRASLRIVEPRAATLLEKLGLDPRDITKSDEELVQLISGDASSLPSPSELESLAQQHADAALNVFAEQFAKLDPSLLPSLEKAQKKFYNQVDLLKNRYVRSVASRNDSTGERLRKLRTMLFPNFVAQERFYGLPYYLCRYGDEFLHAVEANIDIFGNSKRDVYL